MQALTFHGPQTVHYESVDEPGIEMPDDVIVKVWRTAICGSDLHLYLGREEGCDFGTVMGHEFMGEVVACGGNVSRFSVGDVVISPFTTSCGQCFYCLRGLTCRCERGQLFGWVSKGNGLQGAQAEFVRVPMADSTLMLQPEGLEPEAALLLGDVFATGFSCADGAQIAPDGVYVVLGCGPVGLMATLAAKHLKPGRLFAVDGSPERLKRAEFLGAEPINFMRNDPWEVISDATSGRGVDGVLEAVGSAASYQSAYRLVRPGGIISSVGVHNEPTFAFSPVQAYDKNLTLRTGRCPARHYMPQLATIMQKAAYPLETIISHHWPLEKGVDAYKLAAARNPSCLKIVLTP